MWVYIGRSDLTYANVGKCVPAHVYYIFLIGLEEREREIGIARNVPATFRFDYRGLAPKTCPTSDFGAVVRDCISYLAPAYVGIPSPYFRRIEINLIRLSPVVQERMEVT